MLPLQSLAHHDGPIWAMKFSSDWQYLAAGGQDAILRIYKVLGDTDVEREDSFLETLVTPDPVHIYEVS